MVGVLFFNTTNKQKFCSFDIIKCEVVKSKNWTKDIFFFYIGTYLGKNVSHQLSIEQVEYDKIYIPYNIVYGVMFYTSKYCIIVCNT